MQIGRTSVTLVEEYGFFRHSQSGFLEPPVDSNISGGGASPVRDCVVILFKREAQLLGTQWQKKRDYEAEVPTLPISNGASLVPHHLCFRV